MSYSGREVPTPAFGAAFGCGEQLLELFGGAASVLMSIQGLRGAISGRFSL